jgi:glycosyltransferase involved in cell wall biosynthesis
MPRVSIMMPAYDAQRTLPMALSSALAQTYDDWECIVVDDGSSDGSAEQVERVRDSRFRLIRFASNHGRPVARGAALDAAGGEYVCMLDADDWMYPNRLAAQVEVLDSQLEVAAASAGMAIVGQADTLVGARCFRRDGAPGLSEPVSPPKLLPIAHAASMLRRSAIGDIRHDPALKLSQDVDFLLRVLTGRRYFLMPDLLYAYSELESVTGLKILRGHHFTRVIQRKYFRQYPAQVSLNVLTSYAKTGALAGLTLLGLDRRVVKARSLRPTPEQQRLFERAVAEVKRVKASVFT